MVDVVQKLSKSVKINKSYCKKITATFLWTTVYYDNYNEPCQRVICYGYHINTIK